MNLEQSSINVVLTVFLFIIGGYSVIVWFFFRGKIKEYDKHLDECAKAKQSEGATGEKVANLERDMRESRADMIWVGDCMLTIAAGLNVQLPRRPSRP